MKKLLLNLLIFFALALCGLSAFQWVREARLRAEIAALDKTVFEKTQATHGLEAAVKKVEAEVSRLEAVKTEFTETVKTNRQEILRLTKYSEKLEKEIDTQKQQTDIYKEALDKANKSITKQNEDVKKQNEDIKQLVEERNSLLAKFNKMVAEYNDLVKEFNKLQEQLAKAPAPAVAPGKSENK